MKPLSFFTALFMCLALLLASLYTVAIDPRTYARQQARLNVAERSGFSQEELLALDTAVARYMRGAGTLDEAVFSPREIAHMRDVRALMALCERVLALLAALAALGLALVFGRLRLKGFRALLRGGRWALLALAACVAILAAWAFIDFTGLFTAFHQLLFTNDLWLLSASSTLIRMFPEDFFRAMAAEIALRFALSLLALAAMGKGMSRYADTRR
mgnify:FL=1